MKEIALLLAMTALPAMAQSSNWAIEFYAHYSIRPNITYLVAGGHENTLDLWLRRDSTDAQPTVVFIHGGGWTGGTKEAGAGFWMPYLEMGWNVVNVDYRVARVSPAPAAVEDCLCALRWIATNAKQFHIDLNRLVLTGDSAGGHLALTTGMIPESAGLDRQCNGAPLPKVAAIVDFYGIADVNDLLDGPNRRAFAVQWLGASPNREVIAKRVSPIEYVRSGLPPVMIIHGDADSQVPYQQSVRLKAALDKADVPAEFVTVPGGNHGFFSAEQYVPVYAAIKRFLKRQGLPIQ
jgi:acetyl esterase/lipase